MYRKLAEAQLRELKRGIVNTVPNEEMLLDRIEGSLRDNQPLRIKLGIDPTSPELHLGHLVPVRKLMQFHDLGHHAILIIGTFTGLIGDPEGRKTTRPHISEETVLRNAHECESQIRRLIGTRQIEIVFNGDWLKPMTALDFSGIIKGITIQQLLARKDFAGRMAAGSPLHVHELIYPTVMGYDSVYLQSDVELGATEQLLNIYMGRHMQEQNGLKPQLGMLLPVLPGLDGIEKMSKSLSNYIGLQEAPKDIFAKVCTIPDDQIALYWTLLTSKPLDEISQIEEQLKTGAITPANAKRELALEIVTLLNGGPGLIALKAAGTTH